MSLLSVLKSKNLALCEVQDDEERRRAYKKCNDDVVLYARENDVMELELEQWREALETRGLKVSRAKAEYMCLNGTLKH